MFFLLASGWMWHENPVGATRRTSTALGGRPDSALPVAEMARRGLSPPFDRRHKAGGSQTRNLRSGNGTSLRAVINWAWKACEARPALCLDGNASETCLC